MKFATFIKYGNRDAVAEHRPAHREYLGRLHEQGKLATAGPFTDDSGALIVYEAESLEAAEALFLNDPFRKIGVFQNYEMKPWKQVF